MKFVIIYKYKSTEDKHELERELEQLSTLISTLDSHETFIFDKDVKKWQEVDVPRDQASLIVFKELKECDAVIAYINHSNPSEGMHLEAGYAKALGKEIILCVKKGESTGRMRPISDTFIQFKDFEDLKKQLTDYLNKAVAVSQ
ncbi:nucleoside 2-deoxyribosyltransferase [Patescibacteria group bacterium]